MTLKGLRRQWLRTQRPDRQLSAKVPHKVSTPANAPHPRSPLIQKGTEKPVFYAFILETTIIPVVPVSQ